MASRKFLDALINEIPKHRNRYVFLGRPNRNMCYIVNVATRYLHFFSRCLVFQVGLLLADSIAHWVFVFDRLAEGDDDDELRRYVGFAAVGVMGVTLVTNLALMTMILAREFRSEEVRTVCSGKESERARISLSANSKVYCETWKTY